MRVCTQSYLIMPSQICHASIPAVHVSKLGMCCHHPMAFLSFTATIKTCIPLLQARTPLHMLSVDNRTMAMALLLQGVDVSARDNQVRPM